MVSCMSAAFAMAQAEFRTFKVRTPDDVMISAQEWGNPGGLEILMIHGFSQSHLSWSRQFGSALAKSFRIITYDIRGHGGSEKPLDAAHYRDHKRWAEELNAVMEGAKLKRPILVGWSYGGRIIVLWRMLRYLFTMAWDTCRFGKMPHDLTVSLTNL